MPKTYRSPERRHPKTRQFAIGAGSALLAVTVGALGVGTYDVLKSNNREVAAAKARDEIATRFGSCAIKGVTDTHKITKGRNKVDLSITITQPRAAEVAAAQEKYTGDADVTWAAASSDTKKFSNGFTQMTSLNRIQSSLHNVKPAAIAEQKGTITLNPSTSEKVGVQVPVFITEAAGSGYLHNNTYEEVAVETYCGMVEKIKSGSETEWQAINTGPLDPILFTYKNDEYKEVPPKFGLAVVEQ